MTNDGVRITFEGIVHLYYEELQCFIRNVNGDELYNLKMNLTYKPNPFKDNFLMEFVTLIS